VLPAGNELLDGFSEIEALDVGDVGDVGDVALDGGGETAGLELARGFGVFRGGGEQGDMQAGGLAQGG
jgi:hypothetical protein